MQTNTYIQQGIFIVIGTLKNVRSRKTIICFAILGSFILYFASLYLRPVYHTHIRRPVRSFCLDKQLEKQWNNVMNVNDAVVKKIPGSTRENRFLPFTGNGNIAFAMKDDVKEFYLIQNGMYVESYLPVLVPTIVGQHDFLDRASILSIKDGVVVVISSFLVNSECIIVEEKFYAHRKYPGVFHQDVEVFNQGDMPVSITLKPNTVSKNLVIKNLQSTLNKGSHQDYHAIGGDIKSEVNQKKYMVNFTTVLSSFQPILKVRNKDRKKASLTSLTEFHFTPINDKTKKRRDIPKKTTPAIKTKEHVKPMISTLTALKKNKLFQLHLNSWNEIWKAGITISSDHDPDSPSPLHVNLTEYYLYSTTPYKEGDEQLLDCFNGPSTVHVAKHWTVPTTLQSLYRFKQLWLDYFDSHGCHNHNLTSLSLSKLMMLSVIGFQYQTQHLQMALNPLNLRSNISIRHMELDVFHSSDLINLRVVVTQKQLESVLIYVTCDGKHVPKIFACASACEHVVELGTTMLKFPVHTTDPVTPLFYISTNRTHLETIPHAPFMKIAVKTARENQADPHSLKLSAKFWLAVIVLIVSFHVIVLKMIYNECRKNRANVRGRSSYMS